MARNVLFYHASVWSGDIDTELMSVGFLSVQWVSCRNGCTMYIHIVKLFFTFGRAFILVFEPYWLYKIPRLTLSAGALNTRARKNLSFSCNIDFCLGNGTWYAPAYYGSLIGSQGTWSNPCQFQWPRGTLKGGTRGVQFFFHWSLHVRSYHLTDYYQIRRASPCEESF